MDLAMAQIFKRRLFGSLPEESSAEMIDKMVSSAVAMFLGYYRKA